MHAIIVPKTVANDVRIRVLSYTKPSACQNQRNDRTHRGCDDQTIHSDVIQLSHALTERQYRDLNPLIWFRGV